MVNTCVVTSEQSGGGGGIADEFENSDKRKVLFLRVSGSDI